MDSEGIEFAIFYRIEVELDITIINWCGKLQ